MIDLHPHEHLALQRLVKAGTAGIPLGELGLGTALRLQTAGFATIQSTAPQKVWATGSGEAHVVRGAH